MKNVKVLGGELELLVARQRAALKNVPGPQALLTSLQGIDFQVGDQVVDEVTGQTGVVIGSGVRNVETSE